MLSGHAPVRMMIKLIVDESALRNTWHRELLPNMWWAVEVSPLDPSLRESDIDYFLFRIIGDGGYAARVLELYPANHLVHPC